MDQNSTMNQKSNRQFMNIKLFVPRLVWSHNMTELQTLLNITFWPKTKPRICQTSQKTEQFSNIELFVPRLLFSEVPNSKGQFKRRVMAAAANKSSIVGAL